MATIYVGIVLDNPGGIAWFDGDGVLHCQPAPQNVTDLWQLVQRIKSAGQAVRCLIEKPWESPRGIGTAVAFRHGRQMGRCEALAAAAFGGVPEYVVSVAWKKLMCGKPKDVGEQELVDQARILHENDLEDDCAITKQTAAAVLLASFAVRTAPDRTSG